MPGTIIQYCTPRPSVFDSERRDTVFDIVDLIFDRIDQVDFF